MTGIAQEFWMLIPRRAIGDDHKANGSGSERGLLRIKLSLDSECPSTCSLPFFFFILWPCPIEDCSH